MLTRRVLFDVFPQFALSDLSIDDKYNHFPHIERRALQQDLSLQGLRDDGEVMRKRNSEKTVRQLRLVICFYAADNGLTPNFLR